MAMETPPQVCPNRRSSRPQPMGSCGDATPCKVTKEDRRLVQTCGGVSIGHPPSVDLSGDGLFVLRARCHFKGGLATLCFQGCSAIHTVFKDGSTSTQLSMDVHCHPHEPHATQLSRMFRHPHNYWMYCRPHAAHSHTALKDVPPSTRNPRIALGGSCDHALGHRLQERQGADPRTAPFEGTPYAKALFNLDVGDELFEIVRRAGRLRAFADLNGEMSERAWVHWMVFGGSFCLVPPSAYSVLIVAPSVWIWAHFFSTHLVVIVDADGVSQRLRGSSRLLRSRSPRNSMSSRVEQARDRNLSRNLVADLGSSCSHQAAYARHAVDAGSLCSINSVSTSWPSLLSQTNFVVQRFPRQSLPYSCEERQVASARILVFQWRRRE